MPVSLGARALRPAVAFSHLILLEVDIAQVQDGGQDAEDAVLVFPAEAQHLHGGQEPAEVICITLPRNLTVPTLGKGRGKMSGTLGEGWEPPNPKVWPEQFLSSHSVPTGQQALSRHRDKCLAYISFL